MFRRIVWILFCIFDLSIYSKHNDSVIHFLFELILDTVFQAPGPTQVSKSSFLQPQTSARNKKKTPRKINHQNWENKKSENMVVGSFWASEMSLWQVHYRRKIYSRLQKNDQSSRVFGVSRATGLKNMAPLLFAQIAWFELFLRDFFVNSFSEETWLPRLGPDESYLYLDHKMIPRSRKRDWRSTSQNFLTWK